MGVYKYEKFGYENKEHVVFSQMNWPYKKTKQFPIME